MRAEAKSHAERWQGRWKDVTLGGSRWAVKGVNHTIVLLNNTIQIPIMHVDWRNSRNVERNENLEHLIVDDAAAPKAARHLDIGKS